MRRSQRQHGSDRSPHSSRPKKRTGFGPHLLPGLRPKPCAFDSAAECVEANASKGSDRSQHSFRPKKRTGFGPHPLPGPGSESPVLDSLAECVEANASTVPTAVSILSVRKSGQVLVRTYVLKYVEFPRILGGMSGVLKLDKIHGHQYLRSLL